MAVKVFVKTLRGETFTFIFTEEEFKRTTVLQLKTKIRESEGIPEDQQRLIFAGKQLENQRLLSDYGVKHEGTIHLILRRMVDRKCSQTSGVPVQVKSAAAATDSTEMVVKVRVCGIRGEVKTIELCDTEEQFKRITVLQLKEKIKSVFGLESGSEDVRLIFCRDCLKEGDLLSDYGIRHMSTIHTILRVPCGPVLCNDYKSLRAKMSCGHAVTPMSLTDWCRRLLDDEKQCRFVCGKCDAEWSFEEVCKMALLTPEEVKEFEDKRFSNASKQHLGIKECPGCKSRVVRTDLSDLSVQCTACTADRNRPYIFCWQCLKEWKGPAPRSDRCENDDCQCPLEMLWTCSDIAFEDVEGVDGCPSIRACPTCGLLVEHNRSQCKNVICPRCKVEFCFLCLKTTEECQELNPNSYYTVCSTGVAPRQNSIPVWQRL